MSGECLAFLLPETLETQILQHSVIILGFQAIYFLPSEVSELRTSLVEHGARDLEVPDVLLLAASKQ